MEPDEPAEGVAQAHWRHRTTVVDLKNTSHSLGQIEPSHGSSPPAAGQPQPDQPSGPDESSAAPESLSRLRSRSRSRSGSSSRSRSSRSHQSREQQGQQQQRSRDRSRPGRRGSNKSGPAQLEPLGVPTNHQMTNTPLPPPPPTQKPPPPPAQKSNRQARPASVGPAGARNAQQVLSQAKHKRPAKLRAPLDIERDRYPFCLVWTPLPVLSWFLPWIGHTGVSNSQGLIYDFSDDYNVSVDNFAFGSPTKYYQFDPLEVPGRSRLERATSWDSAISELSDHFSKTRHSLCFNNCHQYIAAVLNRVRYAEAADWCQSDVCLLITFYSTYTGYLGFIRQWWPLSVILLAVVVFAALIFA